MKVQPGPVRNIVLQAMREGWSSNPLMVNLATNVVLEELRRKLFKDNQETYLRSAQVADILQVSSKTVARWAKEGKLPFLNTLGGHRRYPESEIRALLEALQQEVTGQS